MFYRTSRVGRPYTYVDFFLQNTTRWNALQIREHLLQANIRWQALQLREHILQADRWQTLNLRENLLQHTLAALILT